MTPPDPGTIDFKADPSPKPGEGATPEGGVLGEIRALSLERIPLGAAKGLDKVVDEIYDNAEHALERDTRDFWLKAKDNWPRQRSALEAAFKEKLAALFERKGPKEDKKQAEFSQTKTSWSELSLVDDGVLEEDMRFTELAGRIRNGADEELAALDQRMAIVLDLPELAGEDNPLAPAGLANAVRDAIAEIDFELKVKLIVIRAFDEGARPEILKLYKDVNVLLKDRGILPTVRYGAAKKPQSGTGPTTGPKTDGGPQVLGSVTLPIMSGSGAGGATLTVGAGGIPLTATMTPGGGAAGMPQISLPGGMPAGAGVPMAGAPGTPAAAGASGATTAAGGAGTVTAGGPAGVLPGTDGGGDPFAMLQQLLLMNMASGRLPGGGGAVPAGAMPGPGMPGGGAPWGGAAPPAAEGTFPSLNLDGMAPGTPAGGVVPGGGGGPYPGTFPAGGAPGGLPGVAGPGGATPDGGSTGAWAPGGGHAGAGFPGGGVPGPGGAAGGSGGAGGGGHAGAGFPGGGTPGPGGAAGGYGGAGGGFGTGPGGVPGGPGAGFPGGPGGQAGATGGIPLPGMDGTTGGFPVGGGQGGAGPGGAYPAVPGGPYLPGVGGGPGGAYPGGSGAGGGYPGGPGGPGGGVPGAVGGGGGHPGGSGAGGPGGVHPGGAGAGGGTGYPGTGGPGATGHFPGAGGGGAPGSGGTTGGGGFDPGAQGIPGVPGGPGIVTPAGFPAPPNTGSHALPGADGNPHATNTFGTLMGLASAPGNQANLTRQYTLGGGFGPGNLIGSLTKLQQGDVGAFPDVPPDVGAWLASRQSSLPVDDFVPPTPNVLRALKSTSLGQQMGQMDTVTLDIVSMLFDQIFGDGRIPSAMKALIGRLQIPMLKVAVLDKTFFSRKSHPARHMLDTLGELSMGLGDGFAPGTPLHQRVDAIITRLIEQFEEDFGVFDRVTEDLQSLIGELNQKADQAGKSESKRILDKERLEVARLFAQNEMKARIEGHELPRAVLRFLSTEWMKLLILAYAKGGRESKAWTSLVETLDILVWSLTPKFTVDERKRLVSILPGLLKRLGKGMEVIGTDRLVRERFNAVLMRCHSRAIAGGSVTDLFQRSASSTSSQATRAVAPPVAKPEPQVPETGTPAPDTVPATPPDVPTPWPTSPELTLSGLASPPPVPEPAPHAGSSSPGDGMQVEEVDFPTGEVHDITAPMPESTSGLAPDRTLTPVAINVTEPLPLSEEMSAEPPPEVFPAVKVKNPFGEGEIEVEEVSFNDLPGFFSGGAMAAPLPSAPTDEFSERAARLSEGDWVEIHQEGKESIQARLSFISPYRSTFVFSNRKGQKVAEYSSYQVTSYLRSGRLHVLEETPLFDRAFGNLVSILRKGAEAA